MAMRVALGVGGSANSLVVSTLLKGVRMRDVRDFQVPYERTLVTPQSTNTTTGAVQSVRSQRSDSVSLAPPPWEITGYEAFFMTASFIPSSVEWSNRFNPGLHKLSWTHGELPTSIWRHGCTVSLLPDVPSWALNQVRSRMDNQIREGLDVSVFAGEARETARFLVSTLGSLLGLLKGLRSAYNQLKPLKGQRRHYGSFQELLGVSVSAARKAASNGDRLASAYLWYMYAVRPLVSDVVKIATHWDERLKSPISQRIYAEVIDSSFGPVNTANRTMENGKFSRGVKSGADCVVLDPQLLRASQYGLTSPLALAWELTTLSFVVDWFTGIGNFLRTLEGPLGVAIVNYYETQWVDTKFMYRYDTYTDLYKSQFTSLTVPGYQDTYVRLKCMLRQSSNRILPAPPFLSLGQVGSSQAFSLLALIVARSSGK